MFHRCHHTHTNVKSLLVFCASPSILSYATRNQRMLYNQRKEVAVALVLAAAAVGSEAFLSIHPSTIRRSSSFTGPFSLLVQAVQPAAASAAATTVSELSSVSSFIDTRLRGEAMRLHTREQAPKEGQAPAPQKPRGEPYVTTHQDYLRFLVDSQYVYQVMEDLVNEKEELAVFRNTGLERTVALEKDIAFMVQEYQLTRPADVGPAGREYGAFLRSLVNDSNNIPEFVCHWYNHYFAHTAGGRMIGKQMAALLLDKRTLEFYKWDGDLNEIKARVKDTIESMAATWTEEEQDQCVGGTAAAFRYGGALNRILMGA